MELKKIAVAGVALMAVMISGCAGTPQLDETWGRSYEEAKVNQTMNPDGQYNSTPVEGQPGPVVEKIMNERLQGKTDKK